MSRVERKRLKKEELKIERIIDDFLKRYMKSVTALREDTKRSLKIQSKEIVKENYDFELSNINVLYLKIWGGVVDHVRHNFKYATIDANKFDNYLTWN